MRGTWDDVNRRLTGAFIALDLDDSLIIGERPEPAKRGLFGAKKTAPSAPRRWIQVTATRDRLIGEVVGSTSFGGEWPMSDETEATFLKRGWEKPWSAEFRTWQREVPLMAANRMALHCVMALQLLGCEVADLEAELVHEETKE